MNEFIEKLRAEGKSENTIKSYTLHMQEYFKWFADSFGNIEFKGLYRSNIQEYKNYLKNIKRVGKDNHNLNGKTINGTITNNKIHSNWITREIFKHSCILCINIKSLFYCFFRSDSLVITVNSFLCFTFFILLIILPFIYYIKEIKTERS